VNYVLHAGDALLLQQYPARAVDLLIVFHWQRRKLTREKEPRANAMPLNSLFPTALYGFSLAEVS